MKPSIQVLRLPVATSAASLSTSESPRGLVNDVDSTIEKCEDTCLSARAITKNINQYRSNSARSNRSMQQRESEKFQSKFLEDAPAYKARCNSPDIDEIIARSQRAINKINATIQKVDVENEHYETVHKDCEDFLVNSDQMNKMVNSKYESKSSSKHSRTQSEFATNATAKSSKPRWT